MRGKSFFAVGLFVCGNLKLCYVKARLFVALYLGVFKLNKSAVQIFYTRILKEVGSNLSVCDDFVAFFVVIEHYLNHTLGILNLAHKIRAEHRVDIVRHIVRIEVIV